MTESKVCRMNITVWRKEEKEELKKEKKDVLIQSWKISPNRYRLISLVGRVFANGPARPGFNPQSCHIKDFKNGTWYLLA